MIGYRRIKSKLIMKYSFVLIALFSLSLSAGPDTAMRLYWITKIVGYAGTTMYLGNENRADQSRCSFPMMVVSVEAAAVAAGVIGMHLPLP